MEKSYKPESYFFLKSDDSKEKNAVASYLHDKDRASIGELSAVTGISEEKVMEHLDFFISINAVEDLGKSQFEWFGQPD